MPRRLTPQDFYELKKEVPQLVGLKVSGADNEWYEQMNELVLDLTVFVLDHHLATGFLVLS